MKSVRSDLEQKVAEVGGMERRQFHQAREAFEYAYQLLAPFLDPETGWHGRSLQHVSFNLICENFPHLAHEEIHAMLMAIQRAFAERAPSGQAAA